MPIVMVTRFTSITGLFAVDERQRYRMQFTFKREAILMAAIMIVPMVFAVIFILLALHHA